MLAVVLLTYLLLLATPVQKPAGRHRPARRVAHLGRAAGGAGGAVPVRRHRRQRALANQGFTLAAQRFVTSHCAARCSLIQPRYSLDAPGLHRNLCREGQGRMATITERDGGFRVQIRRTITGRYPSRASRRARSRDLGAAGRGGDRPWPAGRARDDHLWRRAERLSRGDGQQAVLAVQKPVAGPVGPAAGQASRMAQLTPRG